MGRVTDVKRSRDGLVRSVELRVVSKTKDALKTLVRPISELVLLVPSTGHSCPESNDDLILSEDSIAGGV